MMSNLLHMILTTVSAHSVLNKGEATAVIKVLFQKSECIFVTGISDTKQPLRLPDR